MEIVVNDTNIFIDLHSIRLLDQFFSLPIQVHTVDFVLHEITMPEQFNDVNKFVKNGKLKVQTFMAEELKDIITLQSQCSGNVSFTDCAVWHYAKINNYTLLTGDRQLREKAIQANVTVKGIIYVFDMLVENQILPPQVAATKLEELMAINPRLPKNIMRERIEKWR